MFFAAQDRLKAKLVAAAKEKLAAKDRDKQLQAERRKRAADFINLLHKDNLVNRAPTAESEFLGTCRNPNLGGRLVLAPIFSSKIYPTLSFSALKCRPPLFFALE